MYVNGTNWAFSEKLYCMSCGHQGLWLGEEDYMGLEHLCSSCGWNINVTINIRADNDLQKAVLKQKETENGNQTL